MSSIPESDKERQNTETSFRIGAGWLWVAAFALIYLPDVLIRASEKHFWFDELLTFYFSRLSNFAALWNALKSGIDFNPPAFYLLTRGSESLFGYGPIGTRMPEIVGFFVFSVCLFRFVSRRVGLVGGIVAMLFPMLTGAFYYAYEARPHGITLGFCGLALVCWQIALERTRAARWLISLAACLFAAFMMHCYALLLVAPFALTELFRTWTTRHLDVRMWLALIIPAGVACVLYIPLLDAYHGANNGAAFSKLFPPSWVQVPTYYNFLLDPSILIVVLLVFVLLASLYLRFGEHRSLAIGINRESTAKLALELVLAAGFLTLPILGVVLGKAVNGPFFARYFLSALTGVTILAGFGAGFQRTRNRAGTALAVLMACWLSLRVLRVAKHWTEGYGETLVEPSSGLALNTMPGHPLETHPLLIPLQNEPEPTAVLDPLDYLYLAHYAPRLARFLFFVGNPQDNFAFKQYEVIPDLISLKINAAQPEFLFLNDHPEFLVYGRPQHLSLLSELATPDHRISWIRTSNDHSHFLAKVSKQ